VQKSPFPHSSFVPKIRDGDTVTGPINESGYMDASKLGISCMTVFVVAVSDDEDDDEDNDILTVWWTVE